MGHEEGANALIHHLFHIPIHYACQLQAQQYTPLCHQLQILMHQGNASIKYMFLPPSKFKRIQQAFMGIQGEMGLTGQETPGCMPAMTAVCAASTAS